MGTVNSARAVYGLTAAGTPVGTNIDGVVTIGTGQTQTNFTDADLAYSFKVTSTGVGDVATLTLSSGAVAQTTGTPTITDGDGKDFEGETLGTMSRLYAVLIERSTSAGTVAMASSANALPDVPDLGDAGVANLLWFAPDGDSTLGTITFTFATTDDTLTVTVIGSTT